MTERDQKTIRIGAILVAVYLACFFGYKALKGRGASGQSYEELARRVAKMEQEIRSQENEVLLFEKLSEQFRLDPRKLKSETLVADTSAAILKAAQQGGIQLGPVRETPGREKGRELSTIQIEGTGAPGATLALLHNLQSLGYPLLIDSVQFAPAQNKPGQVKINLTLIILNFAQWKEGPNA